jgi:signal transduction histidine kinase
MADIRRTVGLLDNWPAKTAQTAPEPGIDDIAVLVESFQRAGLAVALCVEGPTDHVSAAVGLALYRITQESLANVAKHAPSTATRVRFSVGRTGAHLTVRNRLDGQVRPPDGVGSGLAGMQARAEQLGATLTAGPSGQEWVVDVRLGSGTPGCSVTKLVGDRLHDAPAAVEVPQ